MPTIPWAIAVPSEVSTELCGVTLRDYHSSPAVQMDVQLRGPQILHQKYGLPRATGVSPDFTTYITGSVFGLEFEVFEDQVPAPRGHPIASIEEAVHLCVPDDMSRAGYFPQALEFYDWMVANAPAGVSVSFSGGSQAPFTTAMLLRGEGFLLDLLDHPQLAHRFLQTLTTASIRQRELALWVNSAAAGRLGEVRGNGPTRGHVPPADWRPTQVSIHFTDDYGGMLPPALYYEFDVQYMLQIADHFGATHRSLHSELLRKPHLSILQACGWHFIDVGTDPYLSITDCREVLHIPFLVQMKTSSELLLSHPEAIKRRYREMVAEGATRMLVELCRGVPEANIRAFIEVAAEFA